MKRKLLVGVIGLTALAIVLGGCVTAEPYPLLQSGRPAMESGSIVFTGIDGNLYVIEPGVEPPIRLTSGATSPEADPAVRYSGYAWAGDQVVYTTQELSRSGAVATTMYAVRPGGRARRIFTAEGIAPFFLYPTPDGSRVGYLGNEVTGGSMVMGSVDLRTREQLVHGRGQPFYSAWSPDGATLLTHVGTPRSRMGSRLAVQAIDDREFDERLAAPLPLTTGRFQSPAYAPDGSGIAVVLTDRSGTGIHLLGADGRNLGRLVQVQGQAASMAWSPNAERLAYLDGVYTPFGTLVGRLFVARIGARRPRLVSEAAMAHFWSPDGTKLLYFEPFVAGRGGGERLEYRVGVYSLLNDRATIVATMRPSTAFEQQILPFVDQYEAAYTIWSPDSRLVVLNTRAINGQPIVHLLDTETLEAGDAFRVSYRRVQDADTAALGLEPSDGVGARALTAGSLPFFSGE